MHKIFIKVYLKAMCDAFGTIIGCPGAHTLILIPDISYILTAHDQCSKRADVCSCAAARQGHQDAT